MEAKQYATKQPMDHQKNQRGNLKNPSNKWKWKYNDPKPMGCSKSSAKRKHISDQCKEIEEKNRMGKTRELLKKIRDT